MTDITNTVATTAYTTFLLTTVGVKTEQQENDILQKINSSKTHHPKTRNHNPNIYIYTLRKAHTQL